MGRTQPSLSLKALPELDEATPSNRSDTGAAMSLTKAEMMPQLSGSGLLQRMHDRRMMAPNGLTDRVQAEALVG